MNDSFNSRAVPGGSPNGYLAQRVPGPFLASSFRKWVNCAVLKCMFPWRNTITITNANTNASVKTNTHMYDHCSILGDAGLLRQRLGLPGAGAGGLRGAKGGPKEGGLNIGQHEGLNMQRVESKTRSNRLLLTTPIPWDLLSCLQKRRRRCPAVPPARWPLSRRTPSPAIRERGSASKRGGHSTILFSTKCIYACSGSLVI